MLKIFFLFSILIITVNIMAQQKRETVVPVMNFDKFEPLLHKTNDTLYLVNFWATWCAPCVEELPSLEQVNQKYLNQKFKMYLVSLDFPNQLNSRLIPFIQKNNLKAEVILLDDPNQNRWIDKVDPSWSGEIPFTYIYKNNIQATYPHTFTFNKLDSIIHLKINQP